MLSAVRCAIGVQRRRRRSVVAVRGRFVFHTPLGAGCGHAADHIARHASCGDHPNICPMLPVSSAIGCLTGRAVMLNVIPYNPNYAVGICEYEAPSAADIQRFTGRLKKEYGIFGPLAHSRRLPRAACPTARRFGSCAPVDVHSHPSLHPPRRSSRSHGTHDPHTSRHTTRRCVAP